MSGILMEGIYGGIQNFLVLIVGLISEQNFGSRQVNHEPISM
jgi:hypothetical protein